ncbi:MAG TPA: hypothetical protein VKR58_05695 [Aquella sp.]|nr:hypothetical protein [Aquella sp.]
MSAIEQLQYITIAWLNEIESCKVGINTFLKVFPTGKAKVTEKNVLKFLNFQSTSFYTDLENKISFLIWCLYNDIPQKDLDLLSTTNSNETNAKNYMYLWNTYGEYIDE